MAMGLVIMCVSEKKTVIMLRCRHSEICRVATSVVMDYVTRFERRVGILRRGQHT